MSCCGGGGSSNKKGKGGGLEEEEQAVLWDDSGDPAAGREGKAGTLAGRHVLEFMQSKSKILDSAKGSGDELKW